MNARNLTIVALLLASLTLTVSAQSLANREPSLNPSSSGCQMRADLPRKSDGSYVATVGDRFKVEAKCGETSKIEIRAFAKDNDAVKKDLVAEFRPFGGSVSWTGHLPPSLAGRTVVFQARARTIDGKSYRTSIEVHVRAAKSADSQPKAQPGIGDNATDGGQGSRGDNAKDDQGDPAPTRQPGLGGNAR